MTAADPAAIRRVRGGAFNKPRDWQDFERMTRDLFAALHGTIHVDRHGRERQG